MAKKYSVYKNKFGGFDCEVYTIEPTYTQGSLRAPHEVETDRGTNYKGYAVQSEKQTRNAILSMFN